MARTKWSELNHKSTPEQLEAARQELAKIEEGGTLAQSVMSVQLFERDTETLQVQERGETQTMVTAVDISYGDSLLSITFNERGGWEIEFSGPATIYTH